MVNETYFMVDAVKGARRGNALRFYSWKTHGGVGEALVEPRWISWDPDTAVAALAYSDAIVFCSTQPSFSAFASLPLQVSGQLQEVSNQ